MDLKNILSFSPKSAYSSSVHTSDSYNKAMIESPILSSISLPPIAQEINTNKRFEGTYSNVPEFLEPVPLIEDYRCGDENYFKAVIHSTSIIFKDIPFFILSSSSCSSESSAPTSPQSAFRNALTSNKRTNKSFSFNENSYHQTTNTHQKTSSCNRNTYFPTIKPKPSSEKRNFSSFSNCSDISNDTQNDLLASVDASGQPMSPTMAAAIAASKESQYKSTTANEFLRCPVIRMSTKTGCYERQSPKQSTTTDLKTTTDDHSKLRINNYRKQSSFIEAEGSLISQRNEHSAQITKSFAANQYTFLTKTAHIKRPRNAWIHFRCHYGQALKLENPTLRAEEISKRASRRWSQLSEKDKKPWHRLAEQDKQAHKEAFPDYKYCPRRSNSAAIIASQSATFHNHKRVKLNPSLYSKFDSSKEEMDDDYKRFHQLFKPGLSQIPLKHFYF